MPKTAKKPFWHILDRVSEDLYILCHMENDRVRYAPLHIIRIMVATEERRRKARWQTAATAVCGGSEKLADKLRRLRYGKGLTQREAARIAGLSRDAYGNMERGITQQNSADAIRKLEGFYGEKNADGTEVAFALFLADSPAQRIQDHRENLGMTRDAFSRQTGIPVSSLRSWETGRKTISRQSWERYFSGRV